MEITKWDIRFMQMAELLSTWSKDPSTKCGCVVVDPSKHKMVGSGYNGYPKGIPDEGLDNRKDKYEKIIHAEVNAILHARCDLTGYTLYVHPLEPCARCMSIIIQSGISKIVTNFPETNDPEVIKRWNESFSIGRAMSKDAGISILYVKGAY